MFSTLVVLAICILTFSGQSLAQCSCNGGSGCCGDGSSNRIYTIAYGHDWGAYEYFDNQGYIRGFSSEIIQAVCDAAGIQCELVWTPYSWCFTSLPGLHSFGGPALMDQWVDACTGWSQTTDRIHIYDFSMPFLLDSNVGFVVKAGSSFSADNLAGKTIGFITGWMADEKCLARQQSATRQNYILSADQIIYQATPDEMTAALQNDEVDAVFAMDGWFSAQIDAGTLEYIDSGGAMYCSLAGGSMMTRKDSNFPALWNRGFMRLRATGKLQEICQASQAEHGSRGGIKCAV